MSEEVKAGHWSTPEGAEIAAKYMGLSRDDISCPQMTDFELANAIFMADRGSLELIGLQTAAKERIRWLSAQLADTEERVKELEGAIPAPDLQDSVQAWCVECFGETTASDVVERNWRFLEEAIELVQSLGGSKEDALKLVDYVYGREAGHPPQEVGGVMITLSALCAARGINWYTEAVREYIRIIQPEMIEKIRAKHASKPHRSPLPGDYKHARTSKGTSS